MLKKLSSAISSLTVSREGTPPPGPDHYNPSRTKQYATLAEQLAQAGVPVSTADLSVSQSPASPSTNGHSSSGANMSQEDDCGTCTVASDECQDGNGPAGTIVEVGQPWSGKPYDQYVQDTYGDLGEYPSAVDTDWDSDLAGSAQGGRGRVVVVSTGKSDWERDHYDEKSLLSHHLHKLISKLPEPTAPKSSSSTTSTSLPYIAPSGMPSPTSTTSTSTPHFPVLPSLYSSSLISQSTDPTDETVLVFPDWKVVNEVENSPEGAKGLYDGVLDGKLGRGGAKADLEETGVGRRRSWVMPYRAVILLCSHKRRDKRCHIAAPLLRSALHTVLTKHDITIDETGQSLSILDGPPIEELPVESEAEREKMIGEQIAAIEGVGGGEGGEVGIFNINHLGGHRYAGVMLILFPSGAYLSYGRVTPHQIPRIVEETILAGRVVPGLLRNAVGVVRGPAKNGNEEVEGEGGKCAKRGAGILGW